MGLFGSIIGSAIGSAVKAGVNSATSSAKRNNSSSGGSSYGGTPKNVGSNGNAPSGSKVGDTIRTAGGDYTIVSPGTSGASYNPSSGLWSVKSGSGGTSGGSSGSSGRYTYKDSDDNIRSANTNTDYAQMFQDALASGDYDAAEKALMNRAFKLSQSGTIDNAQRTYQDMLDQARAKNIGNTYQDAVNDYMSEYEKSQDAIRAEQEANVEKNIAALNAQKPNVQQAGEQANAAAQQQYMNVLNPNGANAEQLAALGLSTSGMSEDAAIRASNAYTQAVNSNEQNVNNQLQAIELAITNARLNGDIATAQQLQSYYNSVLSAGMQSAQNIASMNQWALENGQNASQNTANNAFSSAGLTGQYNGQQTMAGKQLSYTIEGMNLDNQLKNITLALQQAYGMKQAEAEYQAQLLANEGARAGNQNQYLSNEYQRLYNQIMRKQYGM